MITFFLYGNDSKTILNEHYCACFDAAEPEDQHKYILIDSESKFKLYNASEQFKNHFVFFTPSITYGVDFNIELNQDVFIHILGRSIQPSGSFQQATRTRQIKTFYY